MNPPHLLPGADAVGVLLSYWSFKGERDLSTRMGSTAPLCVDSGAFSAYTTGAKISLAEYAEWVRTIDRPIDFAFNLDVLADAEASLRNWRELRDVHGLDTTPVIHFGQHPNVVLPPYLDDGATRLSLGGIAGGATPQSIGWAAAVFRWLRTHGHAHIPVHGLGLHMRSDLARLPWATTDSSTYSNLWRFGILVLWTGRHWVRVRPDDPRDLHRHGPALRRIGYEPSDIEWTHNTTPIPQDDPITNLLFVRIEDTAARDIARVRKLDNIPRRYLAASTTNYGALAHGIDTLYPQ